MADPQQTQQNFALRQMLLAVSPRQRFLVGNFTGSLGGTTRIKLKNVGLTTRLVLDVNATVNIGVANATLSDKGPYNLINRVRLTDYNSTDRVNVSGSHLYQINSVRDRMPHGLNNEGATAVTTLPLAPTSTGNTQALRFMLDVPVAYDPESDLRGAILTQTAVGEVILSLDWNSTLVSNGNADAVYQGAANTTVALSSVDSLNVNVYQEVLFPQSVGGQTPLPLLDLATVYEINGMLKSSDNLAASTEKLINYPNSRSVIACHYSYTNNGALTQTDTAKIRLIANGGNVLKEYGMADKVHDMRRWLGGDLRKSHFFENHRGRPIETSQYGAVQLGFTPAAFTAGNTYIETTYESFYMLGASMPGLVQ